MRNLRKILVLATSAITLAATYNQKATASSVATTEAPSPESDRSPPSRQRTQSAANYISPRSPTPQENESPSFTSGEAQRASGFTALCSTPLTSKRVVWGTASGAKVYRGEIKELDLSVLHASSSLPSSSQTRLRAISLPTYAGHSLPSSKEIDFPDHLTSFNNQARSVLLKLPEASQQDSDNISGEFDVREKPLKDFIVIMRSVFLPGCESPQEDGEVFQAGLSYWYEASHGLKQLRNTYQDSISKTSPHPLSNLGENSIFKRDLREIFKKFIKQNEKKFSLNKPFSSEKQLSNRSLE